MRFHGKVVIITGAGQGMGKAAALEFTKEGASLILNDFNEKSLNDAENEIKSLGGSVKNVLGDITEQSTISSIVTEAMDQYGKIDVLYNNVGGEPFSGPQDLLLNNLKNTWTL